MQRHLDQENLAVVAARLGVVDVKGDGLWGQSDLAGNVWEWTLDWFDTYQMPCNNCADIRDVSASSGPVIRGGSFFYGASILRSAYRNSGIPETLYDDVGSRCARTSL